MRVGRRGVGLRHQPQELVGGERQHAEHAVAHHLRVAADSDVAPAELVLESAIDALTRRAFVVPNLFGKLQAETLQAPGFGLQFFGQRSVTAGVDIDQRDVAECAAVLAICTAS